MSSPMTVTNDHIQFFFSRETTLDETVNVRAHYTGPANIYRQNLLNVNVTIPKSYRATEEGSGYCCLTISSIGCLIGPVLIVIGSINENDFGSVQLASGIAITVLSVISCFFSLASMNRGQAGFKQFQKDTMIKLLSQAKEQASLRIKDAQRPITVHHQIEVRESSLPTDTTTLLKV